MNKQLTNLLSGYQDLRDRYGSDDPLVLQLQAEITQRQVQQGQPLPQSRTVRPNDWRREHAGAQQQQQQQQA